MNQLIKVNIDAKTVSARELHEKLAIGTQYTIWFDRMKDYGFEETKDFTTINQKRLTAQGNETTFSDHDLSVDMAKEICMLQRTEIGKQCRTYFIELEKAWNTPEQIMARALKMADITIESLKSDNQMLLQQTEEQKPKVIFADAVSASQSSILIGNLAKIIKQNGVEIGAQRFFTWLRENGYLIKRKGYEWNMPTQMSMDLKLFEIHESTHINGEGYIITNNTTKVTGKGQQYFINKFLNKEEL